MYPMPYALFLASCSMGSPIFLILFLDLMFPSVVAVVLSSYSYHLLGFCSLPFYLGYSPIELWDSLSGYVHPGIACLAFQASDLQGHSGIACLVIHPGMTLVKLIMIGH